MQFEIRNRWTGNVQFVASIECEEDAPISIKVGFAIKWAFSSDADLRGAVLTGADLSDAVLRGAVLRNAVLSGAVLSGAVLTGADLTDADLRGAVLSDAVLSGAVLRDADLRGAVLSGATAIFAGTDDRGYEFYLTAGTTPNDIIIRAGCRRWGTFAAARTHFTHNYTSNGNVPEIMAKLALLESVAKARGYLTAESLAA